MGYIRVIARLPGIYGDVNRPCPRATPSDSGRFTAINPWPRAITITYILTGCTLLKIIALPGGYKIGIAHDIRLFPVYRPICSFNNNISSVVNHSQYAPPSLSPFCHSYVVAFDRAAQARVSTHCKCHHSHLSKPNRPGNKLGDEH